MNIKQEFLNNYFFLDIAEYETNKEMQDMYRNTDKERKLYDNFFLTYVTPTINKYERLGYNIDHIIFRGFVKKYEKTKSITLLFDGIDKSEIDV